MSSSFPTVQISGLGTTAAPQEYRVAGSQIIELLAVSATFDGTGAAGSFVPAVEIISDSGHLLGTCVAATAAAGDSIEATFAPFLRAPAVATPASSGMTEVDYVEVTGNVPAPGALISSSVITVASTSEAYLIHLFAPIVLNTGGGQIQFHFKVNASDIGLIATMEYLNTTEVFQPLSVWRRLTGLAAGATTFSVFTTTSGAPPWEIRGGPGTAGGNFPIFIETFRL